VNWRTGWHALFAAACLHSGVTTAQTFAAFDTNALATTGRQVLADVIAADVAKRSAFLSCGMGLSTSPSNVSVNADYKLPAPRVFKSHCKAHYTCTSSSTVTSEFVSVSWTLSFEPAPPDIHIGWDLCTNRPPTVTLSRKLDEDMLRDVAREMSHFRQIVRGDFVKRYPGTRLEHLRIHELIYDTTSRSLWSACTFTYQQHATDADDMWMTRKMYYIGGTFITDEAQPTKPSTARAGVARP